MLPRTVREKNLFEDICTKTLTRTVIAFLTLFHKLSSNRCICRGSKEFEHEVFYGNKKKRSFFFANENQLVRICACCGNPGATRKKRNGRLSLSHGLSVCLGKFTSCESQQIFSLISSSPCAFFVPRVSLKILCLLSQPGL